MWRRWRLLMAGQTDAGLSSLSGLVVGIYAARVLTPEGMGAYGIFFSLFALVSQFPTQLFMGPAQALAVRHDASLRLGVMRRSLPWGLAASIATGLLMPLAIFQLHEVPREVVIPLAITSALMAVVSPIQDHVRTMLHVAGTSWLAARVAAVQAAGVVAGLILLPWLFGAPWAPFGAMVLGRVVSLVPGLLPMRGVRLPDLPSVGEMWDIGRHLTITGVASSAGHYAVATVVQLVAGIGALGYYEAARVAARPPQVFGMGLMAVASPQLMEAAVKGDRDRAYDARKSFWILSTVVGLVYLAWAATPWPGNPLATLIPNAYELAGLAALEMVGYIIWNLSTPMIAEFTAARHQHWVSRLEGLAQAIRVVLAPLAALWGSYAVPFTQIVSGAVKTGAELKLIGRIYPEAGTPAVSVSKSP
jgi:O-antigen/teichoic acid export membrane protein